MLQPIRLVVALVKIHGQKIGHIDSVLENIRDTDVSEVAT